MFIKRGNIRKSNTSSIADVIQDWLKHNHLEDKLLISNIVADWENMAGKLIARHTKSIQIENKVLKIVVDNAPLRQQLSYSKTALIKLVNEKAGRQLVTECLLL